VTLVFVITESKMNSYLSTVKDNMRGFLRIDVVPCERTEEQIDMTVASRGFAHVPKVALKGLRKNLKFFFRI
jgi:hypothetical protein